MSSPISQIPDSHLLFWRMVESLDIPLAEAVRKDEVSPEHLSKMLVKCAHCTQPHYCALYLAARDSHAETPPSFCVNRTAFARLHALHPARKAAEAPA
jgi:hypothetical protein